MKSYKQATITTIPVISTPTPTTSVYWGNTDVPRTAVIGMLNDLVNMFIDGYYLDEYYDGHEDLWLSSGNGTWQNYNVVVSRTYDQDLDTETCNV